MKQLNSPKAPQVVGPYSHAVISNGFVFCAGMIGTNPQTNVLDGDIKEQTIQTLNNIQEVLKAAGSSIERIVSTTCYLQNMADYVPFNEAYGQYLNENKPARTTVEVAKLPREALVEITVIAENSLT
jgi:2-iminobutanoate/2-iminopropanoate deaminase